MAAGHFCLMPVILVCMLVAFLAMAVVLHCCFSCWRFRRTYAHCNAQSTEASFDKQSDRGVDIISVLCCILGYVAPDSSESLMYVSRPLAILSCTFYLASLQYARLARCLEWNWDEVTTAAGWFRWIAWFLAVMSVVFVTLGWYVPASVDSDLYRSLGGSVIRAFDQLSSHSWAGKLARSVVAAQAAH